MPEIIALSGYARSGKDTVANFLIEEFGFERVAFADPIRDAIFTLNPLVTGTLRVQQLVETLGWDNIKTQYPEVRRLLQVLGTEVARDQWKDSFWIDLAFDGMLPEGKYVITDCRFPNEADAVNAHLGRIWRVDRPGVGPVNGHASDNSIALIKPHQVLNNDGTLEDLRSLVRLVYTATAPLTPTTA